MQLSSNQLPASNYCQVYIIMEYTSSYQLAAVPSSMHMTEEGAYHF